MLRTSFARDVRRRFARVKTAVVQLVVTDDAFGLEPNAPFSVNAERQVWRFLTNEQKLTQFRRWLTKLVDEEILTTDAQGRPWTGRYVESAYRKGVIRAFVDARGKDIKKSTDFFEGTKEQFLRSAFAAPERLAKVRLLATRAFEELRGITNTMATQLNRALANGIVQGQNPKQIARVMVRNIDGLSKARANMIARTEIVHAHAEGQLDTFEELGEDVGVLAEWSTAGDDRVCPQCSPLEGKTFTVEEARGLIPRHPNCRCAWIPADEATRRTSLRSAIARSIRAERPNTKAKEARSRSTWAGKKILAKKGRKR